MANNELTPGQWMDLARKPEEDAVPAGVPRAPTSTVVFSRFADPMFFLYAPIGWKPNPDQVGQAAPVQVPAGFVTDLASIPRPFWTFLRPDGRYAYAAIVHDYLYWTQERPRAEADLILKFAMEDFDVGAATIATIYNAICAAGGLAWRNNAALKAKGEKRILKRWPNDPRITWEEWKRQPDVFA